MVSNRLRMTALWIDFQESLYGFSWWIVRRRTGGTAAHSYFVSMLMRVALGAGHGCWDELSGAMRTFMMAKARAEG
jgi:hypothetical protein